MLIDSEAVDLIGRFQGAPANQIVAHGQDRDQRIADLERQLMEAKVSVAALQKTIESLSTEVQALRQPGPRSDVVAATTAPVAVPPVPPPSQDDGEKPPDAAHEFAARVIGPENRQRFAASAALSTASVRWNIANLRLLVSEPSLWTS